MTGRVASDQALAVPVEPVARLDPTGCDPSRIASFPPMLPPFLRGPERPRRSIWIAPDISRMEQQAKTRHDNTWTIHYFWMNRIEGFFDKCETTCVNSRRYRQWLETYNMPEGIPPHIQFGGAVVAGEHDPEFYNRWLAYARETFA